VFWNIIRLHQKSITIFVIILTLLLSASAGMVYSKSKVDVELDKSFFSELANMNPVARQFRLEAMRDKVILARGFVESFEQDTRYRRKYRIVVIDNESEIINVRFYIYTNEKDFGEVLQKGDIFEFTGQFVIETPINSKMDAFIFDVLLEDGALVVQ